MVVEGSQRRERIKRQMLLESFLRLLSKALALITFALEVGYKGNITQNFRKFVVKVPSMKNISPFILRNNARAIG